MPWEFAGKISAKGQQEMLQRSNELYAWAQERGLTYYWEDPYRLSDQPFRFFKKTVDIRCYDVIAGQWKGVELYAFGNLSRSPDAHGDGWTSLVFRTLVMVPLRGAVPHLAVVGKRAGSFQHWARNRQVHVPWPPAQDPQFNATFKAYSDVPNYAIGVLNDQMRQWLTSRGDAFTLEMNQRNVLLIQRQTPVEQMEWLLDYAAGFVGVIPEELWQWYPPPEAAAQPGATPPQA